MPRRTTTLERVGLPTLIVALAVAHIAYLYRVTGGWLVDDAFISFRYVENWHGGLGLVFNPGERVEGYTNFLWVALLCGAKTLGAPLIGAARAMGIVATLGTVLLLYEIGIRRVGRRLGWVPAALAAVNHSLMTWSFGGLEMPLFLLLLLLGTYGLFVRPTRWATCAFALMALTRPEGYLLLLIGAPMAHVVASRPAPRWQRLGPSAVAGLLVGGHLAFKLGYYGSLLPNTFYAKVGFDLEQLPRGLEYLAGALGSYGLLIPASTLLLLSRGRGRWQRFLLVTLLSYAGYVIYSGGDPLPGFRLALPLLPLGWLALVELIRWWPQRTRLGTALVVVLLHLNSASQGLPGMPKGAAFHHFKDDKVSVCGAHIGRWFAAHVPPGTSLATNTAGSIPYYARHLRVIDMLGLTDPVIARSAPRVGRGYAGHERHDADHVLRQQPEFVLLCFSCVTDKPCLPSCRELARRPEFKRLYRRHRVEQDGFRFVVYRRHEPRGSGPDAAGSSR
ncbi:MAG: hypothetical protein JRI23_20600 [Deltaproteobacteria bacterium]|nr:hypothetical protein [Deltaproteobacteria bacterium]MBW2534288.1 hypothetical protein [Deltaproteobacteria bacterium]